MTPRENIVRLFRRQGYTYAPVVFDLCPSLADAYRDHTDSPLHYDEFFEFPWRWVDDLRLPPHTIDWLAYYPDGLKAGATIDKHWGIGHEPGSAAAKHMTYMRHPMEHLDSLEAMQAYPFPDYAQACTNHLAGQVTLLHAQGLAAIAPMACTIWEIAWYLRGMETLMMDMMEGDDKAVFLLDKTTEIACLRAAAFARANVDIIQFGDDIGMQSRLMMSIDFYREWIKPRFAKVIQAARAVKPDIILAYHSCGFVQPAIDDLIEVGIDVLNPVQPECMDFSEVHAQYGDRLSFWGSIGTQTTMPFGTPEDVRREVFRNLETAGAHGGLLCTPTHLLEPEVPWENILAYVSACREFATAGA
ncbi:MAG TPA: uroporphyrinogen decarboxylase family protein [Armatimonadota bacterium]|jgi:uroporphyrinogen decarboxylase